MINKNLIRSFLLFVFVFNVGCLKNSPKTASLLSKEESDQVPAKMAQVKPVKISIGNPAQDYTISMSQLGTYTETTTAEVPTDPSGFGGGFGDVGGGGSTYTYFRAESFGAAGDPIPLRAIAYDGYTGNKYYLTADKALSGNLTSYNNSFFEIEYNQPYLELYYHENNTAIFYRVQQEELTDLDDFDPKIQKLMAGLGSYLTQISQNISILNNTRAEQYTNPNLHVTPTYGVTLIRATHDSSSYRAGQIYATQAEENTVLLSLSPSPNKYVYFIRVDRAVEKQEDLMNSDIAYIVYNTAPNADENSLEAYYQNQQLGIVQQTFPSEDYPSGSTFKENKAAVLQSLVGYFSNAKMLYDRIDAFSQLAKTQGVTFFKTATTTNFLYIKSSQQDAFGKMYSLNGEAVTTLRGISSLVPSNNAEHSFFDKAQEYVIYCLSLTNTNTDDVVGVLGYDEGNPSSQNYVWVAIHKQTAAIAVYHYSSYDSSLTKTDVTQDDINLASTVLASTKLGENTAYHALGGTLVVVKRIIGGLADQVPIVGQSAIEIGGHEIVTDLSTIILEVLSGLLY